MPPIDIAEESLLAMTWTLSSATQIKNTDLSLLKVYAKNWFSTCTSEVRSNFVLSKNPTNVIAVGLVTNVMRQFYSFEQVGYT